jgi:3-hydroxybutyryl-CoA dehydrogenase
MGAGIAGVFAACGYRVALYSRREETLAAARKTVEEIAGPDAAVAYSSALDPCLDGADIVSENVAEEPELKRKLFAEMERIVSQDCLLTTNTSSVPIGTIGGDLRYPERLIGIHWFNPPAVMPLVELVRGPLTSDETVVRARALCANLHKETIEVTQDIPGFVVNRLQYALLREALYLVEAGVASIADVDRAVETTLAPRWCSSGPLRLMDLAGLDTVEKVSAVLMPALSRSEAVPQLVQQLVAERAFGAKRGRGFYEWTDDSITGAKLDRDATVRLLSERRKARSASTPLPLHSTGGARLGSDDR